MKKRLALRENFNSVFPLDPKAMSFGHTGIQTLAVKAYTASYLQYQREKARKTVVQFVEKWLIAQEGFKVGGPYAVRDYFADEHIESIHNF